MSTEILALIVLLPLLGALVNGILGARLPKGLVTLVACGSVLGAFLLSLGAVSELYSLRERVGADEAMLVTNLWSWIEAGPLTVSASFMLDPLSAVMLLIVTGVGFLIHVFSVGYMHSDKAYWRYFAYLNLFMFSMLLLILGKNILVLFVGWEGVGLCSYLLIGFWYDDMEKAQAGQKAFVTNRVGDFSFLLGVFILLFFSGGDLDFVRLRDVVGPAGALQDPLTITIICLLLFGGAAGKSAQFPLYVWLPDAMAGPTPVSALIHAATMVTAGVYMMCRLSFLFAASTTAMTVIALVGAGTALFAATIALVQNDIKKVLAYSTVSQLGFMVLAVGVGGFTGAIFHLMTHAFFKACLFLGSGSVIHAMHHEQDIRQMGALRKKLPVTAGTFFVSCLAIAGAFPFISGFVSKDEILFTAFTASHQGNSPMLVAYGLAAAAALCTAFYMFRLYYLTFEGEYRGDHHTWEHAHEEKVMTIPLVVLAALAVVGGLVGLPEVTHAPHLLHEWLHPVFATAMTHFTYSEAHELEWILMGVALTLALVGVFAARAMYKRPTADLPEAPTDAAWYRLLMDKWRIDELYAAVVLNPLRRLAGVLHTQADVKLIDGLFVRGTARLVGRVGDGLRVLQNGDVQTYVTAIVVGLAVLLLFVV
ncbi:MAG: NADH-quinone oxidoreductase subunit L [Deltaproteobacteria bacterium]|nr:NADH-quinone oxidoreductase subunit L [Deltaproteobacteria bacterium]MCB9785909.1 NADH-quinone oxidoreductase subunit L [Deltaproteobacteria bacterium]